MAQLDADQYLRLTQSHTYEQSDGLFWDKTNSLLVLVINGAVVFSIDAAGTMLAGALEAEDLNISGQAQGDLLRYSGAAWELLSAATDGQILVGDGSDPVSVAISGDATLTNAGVLTVADVTLGSDAAGDIQYKTSATAMARLGIGKATQQLVVNSAGTAPAWSGGQNVAEDFNALATTDQVAIIQPDGTAADGTTDVLNHIYTPGNNVICCESLGAGQTLFPAIVANGLDIGGDQTDDEGWELYSHFLGASGKPFIAQTDAAFYFLCKFEITDVSGTDDFHVGFRRAEICRPNFDDYVDAAAMGIVTSADPAAVQLETILNNGVTTTTDTTDTLADTVAVQFKILVDAAGAVTYQHDIATPGTLAAPSSVAAFTIDAGDPVIPFVRFINAADLADAVIIHEWDAGYQ